jgi:hypothetical protein
MAGLTKEEFMALGEIAKVRRQIMVNMFAGTQLKFGTLASLKAGKSLLTSGKKLHSNGGKLSSGAGGIAKASLSLPGMQDAFKDFLAECADVQNIGEVIEVIGAEAMQNLVAEVTPVLGVLYSGFKTGKAAKTVVQDGMNLYKSSGYKKGFLRGDPYAAAEAVQTIIQRDLAKHSVKLARQATATGMKIAGLFADLGTATTAGVGVANTLAGIGFELVSLGIDIKDLRAGNRRLVKPESLDLTVFEDCPILGCYLITCADTSSVANFFVADIGLPGWMDKVELMKKKQMDPLLKIANKNIESSRIQLEGLSTNKGTHSKKGFFAGIKSKALHGVGLT